MNKLVLFLCIFFLFSLQTSYAQNPTAPQNKISETLKAQTAKQIRLQELVQTSENQIYRVFIFSHFIEDLGQNLEITENIQKKWNKIRSVAYSTPGGFVVASFLARKNLSQTFSAAWEAAKAAPFPIIGPQSTLLNIFRHPSHDSTNGSTALSAYGASMIPIGIGLSGAYSLSVGFESNPVEGVRKYRYLKGYLQLPEMVQATVTLQVQNADSIFSLPVSTVESLQTRLFELAEERFLNQNFLPIDTLEILEDLRDDQGRAVVDTQLLENAREVREAFMNFDGIPGLKEPSIDLEQRLATNTRILTELGMILETIELEDSLSEAARLEIQRLREETEARLTRIVELQRTLKVQNK